MIPVGLDCETALIRQGLQAPPLACVAIGTSDHQTLFSREEWLPTVTHLLQDPNILLVGHNIGFDFGVLINDAPHIIPLVFDAYEANRVACTQCRQKLCDIAGGVYRGFDDIEGETQKLNYALDDLALRHLGRTLDKGTWRLQYGELIPVPFDQWPEGAKRYPLEDVRATVDVFAVQEQNAFFLDDQFRQARASFWLRLMTMWGIRTDERGIRELADRTRRAYDEVAAELRAAGLLRADHRKRDGGIKEGSRDTKAAQARVIRAYSGLGKEVPLTDGGKSGDKKPCLDKVTCEESGDPILIKYAQITSLKNVLSKDIPMLREGMFAPIHTTIEDILETGRTSSRKPNIQNQRRTGGIRECFVPRCLKCSRVHTAEDVGAGHCLRCLDPVTVLFSCDYEGVELRTLAQACITILGRSRLAEALNNGQDPHLMMAAAILRRPYADLKVIKKAGAGPRCVSGKGNTRCHCDYCMVINARQTGKVANFGFPGGLGAAALVFFALNNYDVHLTEDEARNLKRLWLQEWPEMRDYFAWISSHTDKPFPQIVQLFVNRYRGNVRYTEACNSIFQGMAADIAKAAGWDIFRACYDFTLDSPLYGCRIVNFVHDEFVGEAPENRAHEAAYEVRRLMLKAAAPFLPDVKSEVEPALMRRYSKDAKAVFDDDKRLIPWAA